MIVRPICPRCGGPMKITIQGRKEDDYKRKRFRCKRSRCHYATTNALKVQQNSQ